MEFVKLLKSYGLNTEQKIKLVRHQDSRFDLHRLYINDQIDIYQRRQGKAVFSNCDKIIAFLADDGRRL